MKRLLLVLIFMALAVVPASAQIHFTATLNGAQETPPIVTTATGTGSFDLSDDFTELHYVITYQGLSDTLTAGGHFHKGLPGVPGGIVRNIATHGGGASGTVFGTWKSTDASQPLTPALVESLLTGRLYVNFHTLAHSGGEIRGQVLLATSLHFEANLEGAQQVPPVVSAAGGTGVFVLDTTRTRIDYWLTYRGLSDTLSAGGHVHTGAPGTNGGIVKNLATHGDTLSATIKGSWTSTDATQPLTPAIVDSIIAGKAYANFHTPSHPGGEIRGALVLKGGIGFVAALDGTKENPPTGSLATATGSFILNGARNQLTYAVTYIGLASPLTAGGHIHSGSPGRNGSIVRNLASTGDSASGTIAGVWKTTDAQPLTPALLDSLFMGRLYANFHSSAAPGGEIRGQLDMTTGVGFTARFDGSQENPAVATSGTGTASVVLHPNRNGISYTVTYFGLTGALSGAGGHFHAGGVGVNGPIVKNIASGSGPSAQTLSGEWTTADGTQPLTAVLVDSLIGGKMYMNFHTIAHTGGEIRGQLQYGFDVVTSVEQSSAVLPDGFQLHQNFPNPFNPSTSINLDLPVADRVLMEVYDILGRQVATLVNEELPAGSYTVRWDAKGLASGVYLYRIATGKGFVAAQKMMFLK